MPPGGLKGRLAKGGSGSSKERICQNVIKKSCCFSPICSSVHPTVDFIVLKEMQLGSFPTLWHPTPLKPLPPAIQSCVEGWSPTKGTLKLAHGLKRLDVCKL